MNENWERLNNFSNEADFFSPGEKIFDLYGCSFAHLLS